MKLRYTGVGDKGPHWEGRLPMQECIDNGLPAPFTFCLERGSELDLPDPIAERLVIEFPFDLEVVGQDGRAQPMIERIRGQEPTHKPRPAQRFGRRRMNNYRDK